MRTRAMLLSTLLLVGLSGCASSKLASNQLDQEAKRFAPPADVSYLYVIRRKAIRLNGLYMPVAIDQKVIGSIGNHEYLLAEISPGVHQIDIGTSRSSKPIRKAFHNPIRLEVETLPGRVYFIAGHMTMGPPNMQIVGEDEGKALLDGRKFKRVELLQ